MLFKHRHLTLLKRTIEAIKKYPNDFDLGGKIRRMYRRETDTYEGIAGKLLIPSNCFVLWNSKLIHANIGINNPELSKINQGIERNEGYLLSLQQDKKLI